MLGAVRDTKLNVSVTRDYNNEWKTPRNVSGGRKQEHWEENPWGGPSI